MLTFLPVITVVATSLAGDTHPGQNSAEMIQVAVKQLVDMQEGDGAWPYEGVYRVKGEIPIGYRVGGTALAGQAILHVGPSNEASQRALERAIDLILKELKDERMSASKDPRYDVRVWGQASALEFLCQLLKADRAGARSDDVRSWIPKLAAILVEEELDGGGWNYANRREHASFVTAPVVQALLQARAAGAIVPDEVFARSTKVLKASRVPNGAFKYSGILAGDTSKDERAAVPGSVGRSPLCEATLLLLGDGDAKHLQSSLDAFHEHWDELEKRRKQPGTHLPPYGIAPYYFYFAHRYAAQAIEMLPEADRQRERDRLGDKLFRTRDEDGTWNDRVFPRSRNYGTSMAIIVLLREQFPLPPMRTK